MCSVLDRGSTSRCYGACAKAWPPVPTGAAPLAGPDVEARLIGTSAHTELNTDENPRLAPDDDLVLRKRRTQVFLATGKYSDLKTRMSRCPDQGQQVIVPAALIWHWRES